LLSFIKKEKKKKKGAKILLYNLLSMDSDYLKSQKNQFYNSFGNEAYKTLTEELKKSFYNLVKKLQEEEEITQTITGSGKDGPPEMYLDFMFEKDAQYEHFFINTLDDLPGLLNAHHLIFELSDDIILENMNLGKLSNAKNIILYFKNKIKQEKLQKLVEFEFIDYIICNNDDCCPSGKIINSDDWIKGWVDKCSENSMVDFFFSERESKIFKKALFENDSKSLFYIGTTLYTSKHYRESYRFLKRAAENDDVVIDSLYLLKSFYDSGLDVIQPCSIKSDAIQKRIYLK
jgi:hypothetical protein